MSLQSLFGILLGGTMFGVLLCGFFSTFSEFRAFRYITILTGVCIVLFLLFMLGCVGVAILNGGTL